MLLTARDRPLEAREVPPPALDEWDVLVAVRACGVCRTDLHLIDGELPAPRLPLVLGHQIVGEVLEGRGELTPGTRVGIPWLAWTCRNCRFCAAGRENLCPRARFTGRDRDGGFAQLAAADARYCLPLPPDYPDHQVAPLLCAGLIGSRALRMATDHLIGDGAGAIGLYGFGASAHIVCQVAAAAGHRVFAFTRPGDVAGQRFALQLGAEWAGPSDSPAPEQLDAAIIFAPAGELVPEALRAVGPGGVVVCAGIHMSDIPRLRYADLWQERVLLSVANLTRRDGLDFLAAAPRVPVRTEVTTYPLEEANSALEDLRSGRLRGAGVLVVEG